MHVIVLGAGASAPYGVPLANEVLPKAVGLLCAGTPGYRELTPHLKRLFAHLDNTYSFPPFDAAVRELFLKDFIVPHLRAEQRATLRLVDRSASTRQAIKGWFAGAVNNVIPEFGSFEEYVHTIACLPKNRA